MARVTDGAAKRLRELIAFVAREPSPLKALMGLTPTPPQALDNEHLWTKLAWRALTLDHKSQTDIVLQRAFDAFRLNPSNPIDWRLLATYLAMVLFRDPRPAGRRAEWTSLRYCELLEAIDRRKHSNMHLSDSEACRHIATDRRSPEYFRKAKPEGLRKALRKARSFEHNEVVRGLVELAIPRAKQQAEQAGVEWSIIEGECRTLFSKDAAEFIASRWRRRDKTP